MFAVIIFIFILGIILLIGLKAIGANHEYVWINLLFVLTSLGIIVGSLHNMLYTFREIYYRLKSKLIYRKAEKLTLLKLKLTKQRHIAIFVPAWKESEVIDKMVENILEKVDYKNYTVFVGTYPNDLETQMSVDEVAKKYKNIVKVVTKNPGPTSKSDCLNNVYEQMKNYEKAHKKHFDMVILHDAEDVVHPYEFLVANYFLLRADAVQIPILPLPTSSFKIIHWIYADEFAMFQMRDSYVREKSGGFVPFAGVGMCLSRRAIEGYSRHYCTTPFPEHALAEDYILASRMRQIGFRILFLRITLEDEYMNHKGKYIKAKRKYFISNWAYFPMSFKRSVKQKTRWLTGIVFQGRRQLGWKGSVQFKENFVKDRRLVFDQIINLGAFCMLTYYIVLALSLKGYIPWKIVDVREQNIYFDVLFKITFLMMLKDMIEKFLVVGSVYGHFQGLLSIPRGLVANVVNGFAAVNAIITFNRLKKGKTIKWDKTDHLEGVGTTPVEVNAKMSIAEQAIALDMSEIKTFLESPYEEELKRVGTWDLDRIEATSLSSSFLERISEATSLKKIMISLLLKKTPKDKQRTIIEALLKENNDTITTNVLEYLFDTQQLENYYKYIREQNTQVQYVVETLAKNRLLEKMELK